jgi:hypothetical protein
VEILTTCLKEIAILVATEPTTMFSNHNCFRSEEENFGKHNKNPDKHNSRCLQHCLEEGQTMFIFQTCKMSRLQFNEYIFLLLYMVLYVIKKITRLHNVLYFSKIFTKIL